MGEQSCESDMMTGLVVYTLYCRCQSSETASAGKVESSTSVTVDVGY